MVLERRLRLLFTEKAPRGTALINPEIIEELKIEDECEIVCKGKKPLTLKVKPDSEIETGFIGVNADDMQPKGISDKSIATLRASLKSA
ncbi:MAG: hypothetical protein ACFE68_05255 [Candidatus Hodarchaeota archaeon]